ncbi:MAG: hypothetical protein CMP14_01000 [Rickettsiales bacterium]|nr:hypothetical protein [Rickettsiales bacterium]
MAAKHSRRNIIKLISITAASVIGPSPTRQTSAQWLDATPYQPAGPFYHPFEPLSIDNDLLYNLDPQSRATGEVIYIRGRLTDQTGNPIKNTRIEIWQANAYGRYNHPLQQNSKLPLDPNFLGFGHTLTSAGGHYRFRSIKPAPYSDGSEWIRPPHIHFAVITKDGTLWSTQMYFAGEKLNKHDFLLNSLPSNTARERVTVKFYSNQNAPNENAKLGEFNIVLGMPGIIPSKS